MASGRAWFRLKRPTTCTTAETNPRCTAAASTGALPPSKIWVARLDKDKISVVIVDDQASTRRALEALLSFEPRIVIVGQAANGKEAIGLVKENQPDLVLMDVHMPVLDGLEATREIKSGWPQTRIVVYTMFPEHSEEAYQAGADYFLIKGSAGVSPSQVILSLFPLEDAASTTDSAPA